MSTCTVCNSPAPLAYRLAEADIFRCPSCDHCFSVTPSNVKDEQYEPDYFERHHKNWFANPDIRLFDRIIDTVMREKPQASIIDVGCGKGAFLRRAAQRSRDFKLTGIDLINNEPDSKNGIRYLTGDLFQNEIQDQFDVVVSMAVIEHVKEPHVFVERLDRLCKPGGLVILHTVNDRSVLYGIARAGYALGFKMPLIRLYSKHHLNHYTEGSLEKLMTSHGYTKVDIIRQNMPMAAVDLPDCSWLKRTILRLGVRFAFGLGILAGRTFSQTLISRSPAK